MKNVMQSLAIVIPAYKITYLEDTLDSIAHQTDKRFQLYIGDDCSPFEIERVVDRYRNKIPITYIRFDSNLGGHDLVGQWERCIALTNNEPYIWLFSDDDTMEANCVESFYKALEDNPKSQIFHFNINLIDCIHNGKVISLPIFPEKLTAGEFLESKLRGKIVSYVVEFIFSRELYTKVNGFQNFDLAWGSDFTTWLKMAANSKNGITTINQYQSHINWRQSHENISPNKSKTILMRKIKALIANASFIKNQLINYPDLYNPCRASFRCVRFPLGEILRNKKYLSHLEIKYLCYLYFREVGYPIHTLFSYFWISLRKVF